MKLDDVFENRDAYYDHDEEESDRARFEENLDEFFYSVSRKDWKSAIAALDEINWEDAPAPLADLMSRPGAYDWMDHKEELLRELILWEIEQGHSNGIIDSFNQLDAPWPELKVINRLYNSNKPLLATASEWYPNKEELQDIYGLVMKNVSAKLKNGNGRRAMYDLVKLGLDIDDLPGAKEVFDQNKTVIIKDLLKMIKSGQSAVNVEHYVDMLKDWGINWPELDIIDNSLAAERSVKKIAETDDETRRQGEEMMYTIIKKQFDKNPWFGVYYMDEWNMTPDKIPGLRELLDSHKTTFITNILKGLKGAGHISDIKPQVERLEKVGTDWPELAIIRKSIDAKTGKDQELDEIRAPGPVLDRASEEQQIAVVGQNGLRLAEIKDPSEAVQLAAVNQNPNAIVYIKAPSEAVQLAAIKQQGSSIIYIKGGPSPSMWTNPEVKNILMKEILSLFRNPRGSISIAELYKGLKRIGCPWPELQAVYKSLKAEHPALVEADASGWPASTVLDRIKAKQPLALGQGLQELTYDGMKDTLIVGSLEPYDQDIADWADGVLASRPDSDGVMFQFIKLLHMKGKFPHLIAVLDKHKEPFVKYLLLIFKKLMSNNDMQTWMMSQLKAKISALKDNGLDWPELDVLLKSMQAPKTIDEAEVLSKSAKAYQDAIRKNLTTLSSVVADPMYDLMWHKSVQKLDHAGRMRFLAGLHDEIMAFLEKIPAERMVQLMLKLREFAPGWGNFDKILAHRMGEVEAWTEHTLSRGNNPSYAVNRLDGLKDLGIDVKGLRDHAKKLLINRLKQIIEHGLIYPTTELNTVLTTLKRLGVAVKLGDKSSDLTKKVLGRIDDYISKDGIGPNGTHLIDTIATLFPGGDMPALLKPIYLKNKTSIIKRILVLIKASAAGLALSDIDRLRAVGIDWPEFDIIMKSMKAESNQRAN